MRMRLPLLVHAGALAGLVLSGVACAKEPGDTQQKPAGGKRGGMAFPVEVAPIEARVVEYAVQAVGSVDPFETVQITARVAGVVETLKFSEGSAVQKGTILAEIEPERFRLAVQSARATLDRADAARADAEAGLKRREAAQVENPGLIPGEEIETYRTRVRTASAEEAQAKVALAQAELNLRDAVIRAPVSGTIERRAVSTGQYAQPGTVLATLVRRDPLLLRFRVTSEDAKRFAVGAPVRFTFAAQEDPKPFTAKVTFVAAAADATTRMVDVTGEIDDARKTTLRAGAFVQVTIPIGTAGEGGRTPVVPETAIRPSEKGFLAFVIKDDKAVERVLTLGLRTEDGRVEVKSGLAVGEPLVVRGAEALRDGATVRIEGKKK